jgi:hypothetical protein
LIARIYRYRGSTTEIRRLDAHLWKREGQEPELWEVRNLYVGNSADGMAVMSTLRAAAPRARVAFWQIVVSPTKTLDDAERRVVVDLIVEELEAADHPLIAFSHEEKPRARRGGGGNHLHVVIGHISPLSHRALGMRQVLPRLHKAMAIAAYRIGAVPAASPWHKSIVATLAKEKNGAVADWLIQSFGESPMRKPPRMSDSMRRSAEAAGFDISSFQAALERRWTAGAGQAELKLFLDRSGVVIRQGRLADVIAFHKGALFVGALHRILRRDAPTVHAEAARRIPRLLGLNCDEARSSLQDFDLGPNDRWSKENDRGFRLRRQRKVDRLEDRLASLRLERRLVAEAAAHSGAADPAFDAGLADRDGHRMANADRMARISHAEVVLEAAVRLLWDDYRWADRSIRDLLKFSQELVNFRTSPFAAETSENPAASNDPGCNRSFGSG